MQASENVARDAECAICLGTEEDETVALSCGHTFCESCLYRHVYSLLSMDHAAWCPTCRQNLTPNDVKLQCVYQAVNDVDKQRQEKEAEYVEDPPVVESWWERRVQQYRFRRAATRAHIKMCPRCSVPIEKNRGCNHMSCRCGHHFDWQDAHPLATCHRLHRGRNHAIWGATCPGCSPLAKAKLTAWRTVLVIGAVPVGAAVAAVALPVAPFVLASKKLCKEVRRRRLRPHLRDLSNSDSVVVIHDEAQTFASSSGHNDSLFSVSSEEDIDAIDASFSRRYAIGPNGYSPRPQQYQQRLLRSNSI